MCKKGMKIICIVFFISFSANGGESILSDRTNVFKGTLNFDEIKSKQGLPSYSIKTQNAPKMKTIHLSPDVLKKRPNQELPSYSIDKQNNLKIKTVHLPVDVFKKRRAKDNRYQSIIKLTANCSGGIAGIDDSVEITKHGQLTIRSTTTNYPSDARPNRISKYKFTDWIKIMHSNRFLGLSNHVKEEEPYPDKMYCSLTASYKGETHTVPVLLLNKKLRSIFEQVNILHHVYKADNIN